MGAAGLAATAPSENFKVAIRFLDTGGGGGGGGGAPPAGGGGGRILYEPVRVLKYPCILVKAV